MKFDIEMGLGAEHFKLVVRDIDMSALDEDMIKALEVREKVHAKLKEMKLV